MGSTIGNAFVGYTRVLGAGENRTPFPMDSLIGWYDASDYTSGATWADRGPNGFDLALNNTYSKDASTLGGPSILLGSDGYAIDSPNNYNTAFTANSFTHIEIFRPSGTLFSNDTTFTITSVRSLIRYGDNIIGLYAADTGYHIPSGTATYNTGSTAFVARRATSPFDNTSNLQISYADSNGTALTHYGPGDFVQYSPTGTDNTFEIVDNFLYDVKYYIGTNSSSPGGGIYNAAGYYAANLVFDGILTDSQIQVVFDYYKDIYSLG